MMPKKKSRVFIALGTSLLKWHAILGSVVHFLHTPRWTRVKIPKIIVVATNLPKLEKFGKIRGKKMECFL